MQKPENVVDKITIGNTFDITFKSNDNNTCNKLSIESKITSIGFGFYDEEIKKLKDFLNKNYP